MPRITVAPKKRVKAATFSIKIVIRNDIPVCCTRSVAVVLIAILIVTTLPLNQYLSCVNYLYHNFDIILHRLNFVFLAVSYFRVSFASVSKRVQVRNLPYENEFYSHPFKCKSNLVSYERFCTWTRFEAEAEGNREMVYLNRLSLTGAPNG